MFVCISNMIEIYIVQIPLGKLSHLHVILVRVFSLSVWKVGWVLAPSIKQS